MASCCSCNRQQSQYSVVEVLHCTYDSSGHAYAETRLRGNVCFDALQVRRDLYACLGPQEYESHELDSLTGAKKGGIFTFLVGHFQGDSGDNWATAIGAGS